MEQESRRNLWLKVGALGGVVGLLLLAVGMTEVFLVKAQSAYRQAAARCRLGQVGERAIAQMTRELCRAGNVRVSPDGLTLTFQLPLPINMKQLKEYVSHGVAPPCPTGNGWTPCDVNGDGQVNEKDTHTRDGRGQTFWGAQEPAGMIWGNFMCYEFQYYDSNHNGVADIGDCIDEAALQMDINQDRKMDGVFLPGRLLRFSSTEGNPMEHPERSMTSLSDILVGGPTWVIVKWDKTRNRVQLQGKEDVNGEGKVEGPLFREMAWWPDKPLDHPMRTSPDSKEGMSDVRPIHSQAQDAPRSALCISLWLLRITTDRRHELHHIQRTVSLPAF